MKVMAIVMSMQQELIRTESREQQGTITHVAYNFLNFNSEYEILTCKMVNKFEMD